MSGATTPFGADEDFLDELNQVISQTAEVDIPAFAKMNVATGRKLKTLMAIVSQLVPYKPNFSKLGAQIQASRNTIEDYLVYLKSAGMLSLLRSGEGLAPLGKPEKVYLDNTNLLYALAETGPEAGTVRETFFLNQVRVLGSVHVSSISDFEFKGMTFEVGGGEEQRPIPAAGRREGLRRESRHRVRLPECAPALGLRVAVLKVRHSLRL